MREPRKRASAKHRRTHLTKTVGANKLYASSEHFVDFCILKRYICDYFIHFIRGLICTSITDL